MSGGYAGLCGSDKSCGKAPSGGIESYGDGTAREENRTDAAGPVALDHRRTVLRAGHQFQWGILALANAVSVYLGGWFQGQIQDGCIAPWLVFLCTGVPPLVTASVELRNIDETPRPARRRSAGAHNGLAALWRAFRRRLGRWSDWRSRLRRLRTENRTMWLLILFLFFWKFSPSVGYIERSYLIDVRGFTAGSFGISLAFTLLTVPFIERLRRELDRQAIAIRLGRS